MREFVAEVERVQGFVAIDDDLVARARAAIEPSKPKPPPEPTPLNLTGDDPCCSKRLQAALKKGHAGDSWICPKCGCDWAATMVEGVRSWVPVESMEVFHLP